LALVKLDATIRGVFVARWSRSKIDGFIASDVARAGGMCSTSSSIREA
jgi:hypothetical protein